ncbi:MAG TPA: ABC transporter substrate-binding protein [Thermomicrobiaceae bacterium]|nr:ABC transporter substrate-binding protein [Thermomicrobiaceae bacterium]
MLGTTFSRRRFLATTGLIAAGTLLSNCSSSSTSTPSSAGSGQATGSTSAAAGSSPAAVKSSKNTITFPIIANPGTLNPIKESSTAEGQVASVIHCSLVRLDPTNFDPKPYLAESWEASADAKSWTFKLRSRVKFHDGTDCTADDVKFTMDKMLDPKVNSARGKQFLLVDSTEVVDPSTVTFHLKSPWAAFPTILAGRWDVVPKHILESVDVASDTSFDKKPIGIGPYTLSEWVASDHLLLKANKNFFLGPPKIDTMAFKVLPDANIQIAQLKTGELDAIPFFPDASIPAVSGQTGLTVDSGAASIWYAMHLNLNRPDLFGDQKVRQALSYAIDRQALIDNLLGGHGQIATGPIIPQITWAYDPNVMQYPHDPAKAKALLTSAGWTQGSDGVWTKGGVKLDFTLSAFQGNSTVDQCATLVQQNWADIGVKTKIEVLEFSTFITQVRDNRGPDGYYSFVSYMTPEPEPDGNYAYFASNNAERGSNFTAYKNPEVDQLLETGRAETDQAKRKDAYFKFQEIVAVDLPRIFLFYPQEHLARHTNLMGLPSSNALRFTENAYFT